MLRPPKTEERWKLSDDLYLIDLESYFDENGELQFGFESNGKHFNSIKI